MIQRMEITREKRVFNQFPKYHTKILLGDFNERTREGIFKPKIQN